MDAHDYVLRGLNEARAYTQEGSVRARYCFEQAAELDPTYALAYALAYARLAFNHIYQWIAGWSDNRVQILDKGLAYAEKAVELDSSLALAHAALCWAQVWQENFDDAISAGWQALKLDPNNIVAHERLGLTLAWGRKPEKSLSIFEDAQRLNPLEPYHFERGCAYYMLADDKGAIRLLDASIAQQPNFIPSHLFLAASHWRLQQQTEAQMAAAAVKRINPHYTIGEHMHACFRHEDDLTAFQEALRASGLV